MECTHCGRRFATADAGYWHAREYHALDVSKPPTLDDRLAVFPVDVQLAYKLELSLRGRFLRHDPWSRFKGRREKSNKALSYQYPRPALSYRGARRNAAHVLRRAAKRAERLKARAA